MEYDDNDIYINPAAAPATQRLGLQVYQLLKARKYDEFLQCLAELLYHHHHDEARINAGRGLIIRSSQQRQVLLHIKNHCFFAYTTLELLASTPTLKTFLEHIEPANLQFFSEDGVLGKIRDEALLHACFERIPLLYVYDDGFYQVRKVARMHGRLLTHSPSPYCK